MFGHTIAVHLRAQLSHFELCMVSSKIDQRQCFKGSKGKGEVHIMTTIIPTISYFNLEGVCFSFASFFFHFNSIIGRFTFTIFFKSLPEIHQSRQKQDLFKKACPPPHTSLHLPCHPPISFTSEFSQSTKVRGSISEGEQKAYTHRMRCNERKVQGKS